MPGLARGRRLKNARSKPATPSCVIVCRLPLLPSTMTLHDMTIDPSAAVS